jgi:hypothetical protein
MQVNPGSRSVIPQVSDAMKQFLVAIVRDEIIQPGNFDSSKPHLEAYCENEGVRFAALYSDLLLFLGLLNDYNQTKDPVLYQFLTWQASNCFIDEAMFRMLPVAAPEEIDPDLFCRSTSANDWGMVGAHLIGL